MKVLSWTSAALLHMWWLSYLFITQYVVLSTSCSFPFEYVNISVFNTHLYVYLQRVSGSTLQAEVLTTIGFLKESPQVNIHGFCVYHKNRLILVRHKLVCSRVRVLCMNTQVQTWVCDLYWGLKGGQGPFIHIFFEILVNITAQFSKVIRKKVLSH